MESRQRQVIEIEAAHLARLTDCREEDAKPDTSHDQGQLGRAVAFPLLGRRLRWLGFGYRPIALSSLTPLEQGTPLVRGLGVFVRHAWTLGRDH